MGGRLSPKVGRLMGGSSWSVGLQLVGFRVGGLVGSRILGLRHLQVLQERFSSRMVRPDGFWWDPSHNL